MKSTLYDINGLFQMVRRYYVQRFPYSVQPNAIGVVNDELKWTGSSAKIRYVDDSNTSFENPSPAVKPDSVFGHNPAIRLEEYLEGKQDREMLIEDIKALRAWLIKAGYLYVDGRDHTATEELLRTYNLTK